MQQFLSYRKQGSSSFLPSVISPEMGLSNISAFSRSRKVKKEVRVVVAFYGNRNIILNISLLLTLNLLANSVLLLYLISSSSDCVDIFFSSGFTLAVEWHLRSNMSLCLQQLFLTNVLDLSVPPLSF